MSADTLKYAELIKKLVAGSGLRPCNREDAEQDCHVALLEAGTTSEAQARRICERVVVECKRDQNAQDRGVSEQPPEEGRMPVEHAFELLDRLPAAEKDLLTARYRDGLTWAELAERENTTPMVVRGRHDVALKKLRNLLSVRLDKRKGDK